MGNNPQAQSLSSLDWMAFDNCKAFSIVEFEENEDRKSEQSRENSPFK
jgi:hypothetical protein